MRRLLLGIAGLAAVALLSTSGSAAPVDGSTILDQLRSSSPIQEARVFCYNRVTGRFIHWGSCTPVRRVVPRVYCMNRYTHRFLHWGHC